MEGGAGEALFQRRIEFHPARRSYAMGGAAGGGDFQMETLNPAEDGGKAEAAGRSAEGGGEKREKGPDPELAFRIEFGRIGAGLANLGNTCYLNSVLQCLTYTEPFAAYLQSGRHKSTCNKAGFCAMCALQNHVMAALKSTGKILSPLPLVRNLRSISRNFRNSRQEDAHEYMVNLLESMHKCCLPSGVPSESPSAYEKSLVHKIFGGRLRSQVECMDCHNCSNKFDPFLDLSLEIDKADSVHKALLHFTAFEELDGGQRQYQCQICKQKVKAKKRLTVHKAPYVLTIHLKRFGIDIPAQKINKRVKFDPTLNLKPFVSDQQESDLMYTLYGVLVHAGWSTQSGHYYCYIRTSSGFWYSLNDNQVTQVGEKAVFEQKAYMLFYIRNRRLLSKRPLGPISKERNLGNVSGNRHGALSQCSKEAASCGQAGKKICISENRKSTTTATLSVHRHTPNAALHILMQGASSQLNDQSSQQVSSSLPNVDDLKPMQQSNGETIVNNSLDLSLTQNHAELPLSRDKYGQMMVDNSPATQVKENNILEPEQEKRVFSSQEGHGVLSSVSQKNKCNDSLSSMSLKHSTFQGCALSSLPEKDLTDAVEAKRDASVPKVSDVNSCHGSKSDIKLEDASLKENGSDTIFSRQFLRNVHPKVSSCSVNGATPSCDANAMYDKSLKRQKKMTKKAVHFGRKNLLMASWCLRKKKHKRCKKKHQSASRTLRLSISGDQEPSTSEMVNVVDTPVGQLEQKQSKGFKKLNRKRSKKGNGIVDSSSAVKLYAGSSSVRTIDNTVDHSQSKGYKKLNRKRSKKGSEIVDSSSAVKLYAWSSSVRTIDNAADHSSPRQSKVNLHLGSSEGETRQTCTHDAGTNQSSLVKMLMRGISITKVPKWDDSESYASRIWDSKDNSNGSIGYVLDDWDEEYDRGKRKKVKWSGQPSDGSTNPFQEVALKDEKHRLKKKMMLDRPRLQS